MSKTSIYDESKPRFEIVRNMRFARKKKLNTRFLGQFLEVKANLTPDFPVLTFENPKGDDLIQTYADLHKNSHKFARALLEAGVNKGDKYAAIMYNYPEMVHLFAAAGILGAIIVLIDPRSKGRKLAHQISNSKCKVVFTTSNLLENIEEIRGQIPDVSRIFVADKPDFPATGDIKKYAATDALLNNPFKPVDYQVDNPKHPMQIIYTSGTTGDPKGVTHENYRIRVYGLFASRLYGVKNSDVLYTGLSMTHGNAIGLTLAPGLYRGIKTVFSTKFTKSRLWDISRKYGVTMFSMLGGVAAGIFNEPPKSNDADNPVRQVISAGMPKAIWADFEKRYDVQILEWYSTLEGGGVTRKPPGKGPIGSCGKPIKAFKMKVVDENDIECPPNVTGEIIAKPIFGKAKVEYYGNRDASQMKTLGGWNRTGDMAHVDKDGWWYFDYRKGGGLRRAGDFIQPDTVERVIGEHPDVSEVAVFGIPAASGAPGESDLVAGISLFEGKKADSTSIFNYARKGLEANSVPSYLLILDEIPMTISQKPQERFLMQAFEECPEKVYKQEDYKAKMDLYEI
ncbi:MAG: AMP-binding protein [Deltaproteobacteria bacterium]|nr:AMP-binding protein [Deltaproteobacteria bacterium]